jgi:carbonic anhydrase
MLLKNINFTLGIPSLLPAWKNLFTKKYLAEDMTAGITVAFIAIPLSLAIALASGVPPEVGLITAIVAGIACALFGGTPLSVCGPAAAMCIIIADIVEKFGIPSLILIGALAGLMQLVSGILGIGRLGRYVPIPVIAGFTAGIGVIILIGQLPRAFGLTPPPESDIFSVFSHLKTYLHSINGACILLVVLTVSIIRGLPKIFPKIPAILPAVATATFVTYLFDLNDVPLIGAIPRSLPSPAVPALTTISTQDLLVNAFFIYLLASLETLLSSSAVDKLAKGEKHNANQELIGQGIGNIASAFFGGIPVTGVIARSATNVRAGAKTRRASIIHSIIILITIYFAAPLISQIPIAALAGVLFSVAYSMINFREFYELWQTTKSEAAVYGITFLTIIFVDLLAGVQAGLAAAGLIILMRATKTHLNISFHAQDEVVRLSLDGALTFLSSPRISDLETTIAKDYQNRTILMDLTNIRNLDVSGAAAITDLFSHCTSTNIKFYIKGLAKRFEPLFEISGGGVLLREFYLISEHELRNKDGNNTHKSAYGRLAHGVQRAYTQRQHDDKRLFKYISNKQDPHTLFITCSDSRIIPSAITSTDPGELFIVRNIGNFVPPYCHNAHHSEAAAIEFAINSFDITDIVVCGHTNCGAMQVCQQPLGATPTPDLTAWIGLIKNELNPAENFDAHELARMNALKQLTHLKTYPVIQERLKEQRISLHAWFYDVEQSIVYDWDEENKSYRSMVPFTPMQSDAAALNIHAIPVAQ